MDSPDANTNALLGVGVENVLFLDSEAHESLAVGLAKMFRS